MLVCVRPFLSRLSMALGSHTLLQWHDNIYKCMLDTLTNNAHGQNEPSPLLDHRECCVNHSSQTFTTLSVVFEASRRFCKASFEITHIN